MHNKHSTAGSRLLREHEVADHLGISISLLQKWRWRGVGPCWIRVGGSDGRAVRYRFADVDAYVEQNAVAPIAISGDPR